ncbi:MAG TPA: transcription elongation factor GreA [Anaerolineaceae bacterium]|uniref:Transcription elongation factor GreA n=1 Tax=Anaerolinea thermophila TaxID=167964 RepID=A0A101FXG4_9CHLR|nr:MAG: Transcription elongation factor GreA [Anaerolinea thermophila]HAF60938.1 transcription elongation factor GreA [Anaerolineaceae bacterium]
MVDTVYLTAEGIKKLEAELEQLKGPARAELSKRLKAAIEQGDLSENADYSKAKEDQGFLEGRIQEIEAMLKNFVIIDEQQRNHDFVEIGATVTIQEGDDDPETYYLVGPAEADPVNGKISFESPIGSALLNHSIGETVIVSTPGGELNFKILEIK